jgi:hypothetical protein
MRRGSPVAPELADPVGSLEVGEHEDVEEFAASRPEGVEAAPVGGARVHLASCTAGYATPDASSSAINGTLGSSRASLPA